MKTVALRSSVEPADFKDSILPKAIWQTETKRS